MSIYFMSEEDKDLLYSILAPFKDDLVYVKKARKSAGQIRILYRLKNMEYSTPPFDSRRFLDLEMNKEYSWDNLFGAKSEKGDLIEVAISNLVHVKQNLESSKIPKDHGIIEILSDIVTFLKTNVSCKNQ